MKNKILNCQNFAFHNVTLRFSHHALSTFISPPSELTKYRCLSLLTYHQGVEPFDFSGSGSVWVQQRFQISVQFRLRFK